jgi:AcrR family transcriptional regulator
LTGLSPKGARTREAILVAAEDAFAQHGFHGASVRDVARAAKVATAGLLHHFPRKEGMYAAVLERIAGEIDAVIVGAIAGRASPKTKLRRLVQRFAAWAEGSPRRSHLLLRELLDNPSRLARAGRLHLAPVVERLTGFVEAGRRAGVFGAIDPLMFVVHLAGSSSYYVAARPTFVKITGATASNLDRRYRRDLLALVESYVLWNDNSS